MNSSDDAGVVAGPASGRTSHTHRLRGLAGTGCIATVAAMVATSLPVLFVGPSRQRLVDARRSS